MPDNTPDSAEKMPTTAAPTASDATPTAVPETPAVAENIEAPQPTPLAENALESAHADVLPLSAIGDTEPTNNNAPKPQNNGHHGLRRGNKGARPNNQQSSQPGLVENSSEVTETLSGNGPRPRRQRFPRERRENADGNAALVDKNIEQARESGNWRVQDGLEPRFKQHPQSNVADAKGKLHIEPAALPVQEKEPSLLSKLWSKVCKIFKVKPKKQGKKFDKKNGKNGNGKFNRYGNNGRPKGDFKKRGYRKNFRPRRNFNKNRQNKEGAGNGAGNGGEK